MLVQMMKEYSGYTNTTHRVRQVYVHSGYCVETTLRKILIQIMDGIYFCERSSMGKVNSEPLVPLPAAHGIVPTSHSQNYYWVSRASLGSSTA